jgi:hypothetical protein
MKLCELCVHQEADKRCSVGRAVPQKMRCVEFKPGIERFCATPEDYTGPAQIRQMAIFFGLAGKELQRVLALAKQNPAPMPPEGALTP